MNVWIIGRGYPNKYNKVQGSFELEQARMMAKAGFNVTYIALVFHPYKKVKKWGYCTWKEKGLTVCTYSQIYAPERMQLHLKGFQQKRWKQLLDKVEQQCGKPDVIHVHYPTMITDADVILDYKEKGTKIVATEHWTKVLTGQLKSYHKEQMTKYADGADAFLCVGGPLRDSVKKISGTQNEIRVVPNVVSDNFRYEKKDSSDCFEYIAVGRLVPVKQFDKIIEAFKKAFAEDNRSIRLTVVGGGKEFSRLKQLTEDSGLSDRITLTGALSRDETARRVMSADALICYSRLETFGVPVIEAWASGKPVIASDRLGFLEYWNDSLGYIVPWNDTDKLAVAMQKLYEERDSLCGEKIAEFARDNFSEKTIGGILSEIYRS